MVIILFAMYEKCPVKPMEMLNFKGYYTDYLLEWGI